MARDFQNQSGWFANAPTTVPDTYPVTACCFAQCDSSPAGSYASNLFMRHASANIAFSIENYTDFWTQFVTARTTGMAMSFGALTHICQVFNGAGSKQYLNAGTPGTGNPGALAIGTGQRIDIGNRNDYNSPYDGRIMEIAFWTGELNISEIRGLAKGVCPLVVRPRALLGYWPFWGNSNPEPDLGPLRMHVAPASTAAAPSRHLSGSPITL